MTEIGGENWTGNLWYRKFFKSTFTREILRGKFCFGKFNPAESNLERLASGPIISIEINLCYMCYHYVTAHDHYVEYDLDRANIAEIGKYLSIISNFDI